MTSRSEHCLPKWPGRCRVGGLVNQFQVPGIDKEPHSERQNKRKRRNRTATTAKVTGRRFTEIRNIPRIAMMPQEPNRRTIRRETPKSQGAVLLQRFGLALPQRLCGLSSHLRFNSFNLPAEDAVRTAKEARANPKPLHRNLTKSDTPPKPLLATKRFFKAMEAKCCVNFHVDCRLPRSRSRV
jgi:hypothetical protein